LRSQVACHTAVGRCCWDLVAVYTNLVRSTLKLGTLVLGPLAM